MGKLKEALLIVTLGPLVIGASLGTACVYMGLAYIVLTSLWDAIKYG